MTINPIEIFRQIFEFLVNCKIVLLNFWEKFINNNFLKNCFYNATYTYYQKFFLFKARIMMSVILLNLNIPTFREWFLRFRKITWNGKDYDVIIYVGEMKTWTHSFILSVSRSHSLTNWSKKKMEIYLIYDHDEVTTIYYI